MTQLTSAYDPKSEEAIANTAAMTALVEDLKAKLAAVKLGGGEVARERHLSRGKLLPHDRCAPYLTLDHPSWNCRNWQRMACMMTRFPARVS